MKKSEIKQIINLFVDKTGCNTQFNNCPCNSCFHAIEDVDFRHICWCLILALRGDYKEDMSGLINEIKNTLFEK